MDRRVQNAALDLEELTLELPGEVVRVLETLSSGSFELHVRAIELERLVARCERFGNRIVRSVIAAAVINASVEVAVGVRSLLHERRSSRRKRRRR